MLFLVRHAPTGETTAGTFPVASGADPAVTGPGLDQHGRLAAAALRVHLPMTAHVWSSHARRCLETAEAATGVLAEEVADLAEVDFGRWAGSTMATVHAEDPDGLTGWMSDPDVGPPGGESFSSLQTRAAAVLGRAAGIDGPVVAVTHGGFVRAALTHVLHSPAAAALALGIASPSVTVLEAAEDGVHWQVRTVGWTPALAGSRP